MKASCPIVHEPVPSSSTPFKLIHQVLVHLFVSRVKPLISRNQPRLHFISSSFLCGFRNPRFEHCTRLKKPGGVIPATKICKAIVQKLKKIDGLRIREGNIYPILARLQTDSLVRCESEPSRDGPPRKYFKLTKSGQEVLSNMNTHWNLIIESIDLIREGGHNDLRK